MLFVFTVIISWMGCHLYEYHDIHPFTIKIQFRLWSRSFKVLVGHLSMLMEKIADFEIVGSVV